MQASKETRCNAALDRGASALRKPGLKQILPEGGGGVRQGSGEWEGAGRGEGGAHQVATISKSSKSVRKSVSLQQRNGAGGRAPVADEREDAHRFFPLRAALHVFAEGASKV